ncbi:MAG TPA: STAS domain-containing protein [Umezawaea sp.]|nr:STAS domain-containing protein [Umezawaea sp.]
MAHTPTTADRERLDVVPTSGEIDMTAAPDLSIDLGLAISRRPRAVIADLTAVRFLGAAGLSALERAHEHAEAVGSRLVVVADQRCVLLPLALTGLDMVLTVLPDLRAARADVDGLVSSGVAS